MSGTPTPAVQLRDLVRAHPLVPILRAGSSERLMATSKALAVSGVRVIELTATTPGAYEVLAVLRQTLPDTVKVGMGTVLTPGDAERARDAGADYLVMPAVLPDVAAATELPVVIGAWTPTEVLAAWRLAPALVKVFPAGTNGVNHVRSLREIYPDIPLLPTGGITADTAPDYLRAGAVGVGLGGGLVRSALDGTGDLHQLNVTTSLLIARLAAVSSG